MSRPNMLRFFTLLIVCLVHTAITWCIEVDLTSKAVSCNGGNDGEITVNLTQVDAKCSIRLLSSKNNRLIKNQDILKDTIVSFNGLIAGKYLFQVISDGKAEKLEINVSEPKVLIANAMIIEKYPSTKENCDGIIHVNPSGGTAPYSYKWIEGITDKTDARLTDLCENIYTCIISDANNCKSVKVTTYLFQGFNKEQKE